MSCTGEVPPHTNKGKSFIHDPKVAGETEVKAQIKLRFYNALRQPFIVIRSFQLTQKKADLTFKALDSTIQTLDPETGQMQALPQRCADLNAAVPVFMGVSKAILENVIFVHQEDSSWPLAEGQVLKKKFDDIFAATKYTKALDDLRKLRKKTVQDVKEMKLKLETVKEKKDQAARLRLTVAEGRDRTEKFEKEIGDLQGKIDEINARKSELTEIVRGMDECSDELVSLNAQYQMLKGRNDETLARLRATYDEEDLSISEEQLIELGRNYEENSSVQKQELESAEREVNMLTMQLTALREAGERESRVLARLQAEAEAHVRSLDDRDRFLREICSAIGISSATAQTNAGESARLPPDAAQALKAAFHARVEEARTEVNAARERHRAADREAAQSIDDVTTQMNKITEGLRMKQEAVRENEGTLNEIQRQLDEEPSGSKEAWAVAKASVQAASMELEQRESALSASSLESDIRQIAEEMGVLASKAEALRAERKTLAAAAEEASRMNFKAQEAEAAEARVADHMDRHRHRLMLLLNTSDLPVAGPELSGAVAAAVDRCRREYEVAGAALKEVQAAKASKQGTLDATKRQLEKAEKELEGLTARLVAPQRGGAGAGTSATATASSLSDEGESVPVRLQKLDEDRTRKQYESQKYNALSAMLTTTVQTAKTANACFTCRRPFADPLECSRFIRSKEEELSQIPRLSDALQSEVKALEEKIKQLKVLEPVVLMHDALRDDEIPSLRNRLRQLERDIGVLQDRVDMAAREEEDKGGLLQEAQEVLVEGAQAAARLVAEAAQRRAEVESMRVGMRMADATRSVSAVDADLADIERERAEQEGKKDAAGARLTQLRDAVAQLRSRLHQGREDVLRLGASVEKRATLEAKKAELLTSVQSATTALIEARTNAAPLEERRSQLQREREEQNTMHRMEEEELESTLRRLQMQATQLEGKERALAEYVERGGNEGFDKAEKAVRANKERQTKEEERRQQASVLLVEKQNAVANNEAFHRQLQEMLAFSRSQADERRIKAELDSKGASMAAVGDRKAMLREIHELEGMERSLRSESDRASGALDTVKETVTIALSDLAKPEYDGIDAKHRSLLIEMRTTEMASNDVEKFHKALERALLAYHTTKMEEINKIVKELWQKTYRNADIDYIQLRADTEGSANRSYNYRVVMICGGAELDMRGRCSAGQRVLASLVIRLALAETFCLNCGILALDEPTTNLDKENAESLAEALKALMLARREQENFQLIVITHDEEFAKNIGTREHADYMWRIIKDENQHSTVLKEDIMG